MSTTTKKGFSLIEVMVVVGIIGLLAVIAVPKFRVIKDRASATTTANDLRIFTEAIRLYNLETGKYPDLITYTQIPDEIDGHISAAWKDGRYHWTYLNSENLVVIIIENLEFDPIQAITVDQIIDDGNIATGSLQIGLFGQGLYYFFELVT